MASVEIKDLRKSYGRDEVIHGIDLSVKDGEFVTLIGASGCGKSTLLRMIAGLEEVTSGTIALDDRVINDVPPKDRDIAMVFQNYALYPHLTVAENMGFGLRLRNVPKARVAEAVHEAADLLGLTPYLKRHPKALSGGQRQRVAMGRAIVRQPQVFLFDEPLSNLDAKLRVQMRAEIRSLQRRLGTTSIYVTHDQIEAMTMSDRIVILNNGEIEQVGAPLDLYDHPANTFVASFIGSPAMNLIDGTLTRENGFPEAILDGSGDMPRIPLAPSTPGETGMAVTVGLRPEHLDLADRNTETDEIDGERGLGRLLGHLPISVHLIEPTGAETHLYGHFGTTPVTATIAARSGMKEGDRIHLTFALAAVHLFDRTTGRAINTQPAAEMSR